MTYQTMFGNTLVLLCIRSSQSHESAEGDAPAKLLPAQLLFDENPKGFGLLGLFLDLPHRRKRDRHQMIQLLDPYHGREHVVTNGKTDET